MQYQHGWTPSAVRVRQPAAARQPASGSTTRSWLAGQHNRALDHASRPARTPDALRTAQTPLTRDQPVGDTTRESAPRKCASGKSSPATDPSRARARCDRRDHYRNQRCRTRAVRTLLSAVDTAAAKTAKATYASVSTSMTTSNVVQPTKNVAATAMTPAIAPRETVEDGRRWFRSQGQSRRPPAIRCGTGRNRGISVIDSSAGSRCASTNIGATTETNQPTDIAISADTAFSNPLSLSSLSLSDLIVSRAASRRAFLHWIQGWFACVEHATDGQYATNHHSATAAIRRVGTNERP